MEEVTKTEGSTTINMRPDNNGWGGYGWGGPGYGVPVVPYGYGNGGGFGDMMRGFGGNINIGRGGVGGVITGSIAAALAGGLALKEIFDGRRGNGGPHENFVTKDYLDVVQKCSEKDAVIGQLKSEKYTETRFDEAMKFFIEYKQREDLIDAHTGNEIAALKAQLAAFQQTLQQLTGVVINPAVLAPSQAVLAQMQNARSATPAASGTGS